MQTDKNKWVEEVMQSANGISRAKAPEIIETVLSKIGTKGDYRINLPANDNTLIWRIAASIVFLLMLNAVTIYSYQNSMLKSQRQMQVSAAGSELGLGSGSSVDAGTLIFGK